MPSAPACVSSSSHLKLSVWLYLWLSGSSASLIFSGHQWQKAAGGRAQRPWAFGKEANPIAGEGLRLGMELDGCQNAMESFMMWLVTCGEHHVGWLDVETPSCDAFCCDVCVLLYSMIPMGLLSYLVIWSMEVHKLLRLLCRQRFSTLPHLSISKTSWEIRSCCQWRKGLDWNNFKGWR